MQFIPVIRISCIWNPYKVVWNSIFCRLWFEIDLEACPGKNLVFLLMYEIDQPELQLFHLATFLYNLIIYRK